MIQPYWGSQWLIFLFLISRQITSSMFDNAWNTPSGTPSSDEMYQRTSSSVNTSQSLINGGPIIFYSNQIKILSTIIAADEYDRIITPNPPYNVGQSDLSIPTGDYLCLRRNMRFVGQTSVSFWIVHFAICAWNVAAGPTNHLVICRYSV